MSEVKTVQDLREALDSGEDIAETVSTAESAEEIGAEIKSVRSAISKLEPDAQRDFSNESLVSAKNQVVALEAVLRKKYGADFNEKLWETVKNVFETDVLPKEKAQLMMNFAETMTLAGENAQLRENVNVLVELAKSLYQELSAKGGLTEADVQSQVAAKISEVTAEWNSFLSDFQKQYQETLNSFIAYAEDEDGFVLEPAPAELSFPSLDKNHVLFAQVNPMIEHLQTVFDKLKVLKERIKTLKDSQDIGLSDEQKTELQDQIDAAKGEIIDLKIQLFNETVRADAAEQARNAEAERANNAEAQAAAAEAQKESAEQARDNAKKALEGVVEITADLQNNRESFVNALRSLTPEQKTDLQSIVDDLNNPDKRKDALDRFTDLVTNNTSKTGKLGDKVEPIQEAIDAVYENASNEKPKAVETLISVIQGIVTDAQKVPNGFSQDDLDKAKQEGREEAEQEMLELLKGFDTIIAQMWKIIEHFNPKRAKQMVAEGSAIVTFLGNLDPQYLANLKAIDPKYLATVAKINAFDAVMEQAQEANDNNQQFVPEQLVANGTVGGVQAETRRGFFGTVGNLIATGARRVGEHQKTQSEIMGEKLLDQDFTRHLSTRNDVHSHAEENVRAFLLGQKIEGLRELDERRAEAIKKRLLSRIEDDRSVFPFNKSKLVTEKDNLWKQLVDLCDVKKDERELIESVQNVLNARNIDSMVQENIVAFVKRGFKGNVFRDERALFERLKNAEPLQQETMIRSVAKHLDRPDVNLNRNGFRLNDVLAVRLLGVPKNMWYMDSSRNVHEPKFPSIPTPLFAINGERIETTSTKSLEPGTQFTITAIHKEGNKTFGEVQIGAQKYLFPYVSSFLADRDDPASHNLRSSGNVVSNFLIQIQRGATLDAQTLVNECASLIQVQSEILDVFDAQSDAIRSNADRSRRVNEVLSSYMGSMQDLINALGLRGVIHNFEERVIRACEV